MLTLEASIARLEATFRRIERERMRDMPLVNPALHVEAVGFADWNSSWLGTLITPWFINLILMPQDEARWAQLVPTSTAIETFPFGDFDFLVCRDLGLGTYKSCTLFSPAQAFADQHAAREAAQAALAALFENPKSPPTKPISRRSFLYGQFGRSAR